VEQRPRLGGSARSLTIGPVPRCGHPSEKRETATALPDCHRSGRNRFSPWRPPWSFTSYSTDEAEPEAQDPARPHRSRDARTGGQRVTHAEAQRTASPVHAPNPGPWLALSSALPKCLPLRRRQGDVQAGDETVVDAARLRRRATGQCSCERRAGMYVQTQLRCYEPRGAKGWARPCLEGSESRNRLSGIFA
jgi:hypothetical protein